MASLVRQWQDGRTESLELKRGINRIGRHPDNDIAMECASLSNHHCELAVADHGLEVRDLHSTNGTFVNEERIRDAAALRGGETLRLGDVIMTVVWSDITVTIPHFEKTCAPACRELEDGSWSCLHHSERKASWHCSHCGQWFCNACVHHLRRLGGKFLNLCPVCSFPCEFTGKAPEKKRVSIFKMLKRLLTAPARKPRRRKP